MPTHLQDLENATNRLIVEMRRVAERRAAIRRGEVDNHPKLRDWADKIHGATKKAADAADLEHEEPTGGNIQADSPPVDRPKEK
jgi:hypothetical protein